MDSNSGNATPSCTKYARSNRKKDKRHNWKKIHQNRIIFRIVINPVFMGTNIRNFDADRQHYQK